MDRDAMIAHLAAVGDLLADNTGPTQSEDSAKVKAEQLRTISRSIGQLEKRGIPVPIGMVDLKEALELELRNVGSDMSVLVPVYERLLSLALQTAKLTDRNLHRDVTELLRQGKDRLIASSVVGAAVTKALEDAGGPLRQSDLIARLAVSLRPALTKADLTERPKGGPRWFDRLYRARRQLVRDGRLVLGRGKNPTWELKS